MFRQQGLAQARAITGQSIQDDDEIQEYNHMEHLNYLKNLSIATDKLTKQDEGDEDTALEKDGAGDLFSAYGVYSARNTGLDMQDKVSKYLDDIKKQGKTAEDLKAAFAEQGGIGSTIKKAFANSVAATKEQISKKMASTYEGAEAFGNEVGEDVQSVAAEGVSAAREAAQSAQGSAEIFGRQAESSARTAAREAATAATSAATGAATSAASAASEAAPRAGQTGFVDFGNDEINAAANRLNVTGGVGGERIVNPEDLAPRASGPFENLVGTEPEVDKFADVGEPPVKGATELKQGVNVINPSTGRARPPTDVSPSLNPDIGAEGVDEDEVDREARDFDQTIQEATEAPQSNFADKLSGADIKNENSTHYPDQAFYQRGEIAASDYMTSDKSIGSMEQHINEHTTKLNGDSFNFRRKYDANTRVVSDEFWPKGQAAPDLLPGQSVAHAGNVSDGNINMTEGTREGLSGPVGEGVPKIPQPFEGESTEPTFNVDQPVSQPTNQLQLQDAPDLPDPEPEGDQINVGDVAEDPHSNPDFSGSNLQDILGDEDVDESAPAAPQPASPPAADATEPTEEQTQQARSRRASFIEQGDADAPPEPRVEQPSVEPEVNVEPPVEPSAGSSAQNLRDGLADAFKTDAEKTAEKTASVFGTAGKVAGKVAAKFGDALGVGANIAGAGYATYEEGKDVFGKHSHLEGDGGWEKAGNLVSMIGDDAALAGSVARFAGPEGAIIGTGLELAGGAVALVGGGLDAIGEYFQGKKKTATAAAVAKKAMPEAPPVQTTAIQNTQGSGGIANVSQSALKNLN